MIQLFDNIESFASYANVRHSMPFEKVLLFEADAISVIERYIGEKGLEVAYADDSLNDYLKRACAPLLVSIASAELGVSFGDSGHTVAKSEKATPASDAKIKAYADSAYVRGMLWLERLIFKMPDPELNETVPWKRKGVVADYDDIVGLYPSGSCGSHSPVLFIAIREYLEAIEEEYLIPIIGRDAYDKIVSGDISEADKKHLRLMRRMVGIGALMQWSEDNIELDVYLSRFRCNVDSYRSKFDCLKDQLSGVWNTSAYDIINAPGVGHGMIFFS